MLSTGMSACAVMLAKKASMDSEAVHFRSHVLVPVTFASVDRLERHGSAPQTGFRWAVL